ncbi:MAG: hypothetical protein UZ03_NOB001002710 [Nitrospira sp. OLB3]|nr:MAG: hypothetical protein UZ03_NOB001002710 [Nitrospira sp. OLB3]RIK58443.1 MAG: type VI secretion system membrane subunit TssM [Nitrospira sp.]
MTHISDITLRFRESAKTGFGQARLYVQRHPRQAAFWCSLLLVVLVLTFGALIGLERFETRAFAGVAVLVAYGLYQTISTYREEKRATGPDVSLKRQAPDQVSRTSSEQQTRLEGLRSEFEQAILELSQSSFGQKALSALPWYLLVGPPASGKSTMLLNSGLQVIVPRKDEAGGSGTLGARTCDWWCTNEALFIDTAGHCAVGDEARGEWLVLLESIAAHRQKTALNGVMVTVSLPDLFAAREKDVDVQAKQIRARLEEIIQRLGVVFPVYLVFTKCDVLGGFAEFFEDLDHAGREEQVWGHTFPAGTASSGTPQKQFDAAFSELLQAMLVRRHARLLSVLGSKKAREIFCFPLNLALAKPNLTRFVDLLFQPGQFQDRPLFRGFYLTSATQEGPSLDGVIQLVNRRAGLQERGGAPPIEPREKRPYFVKHLFSGIVVPDQGLAHPSIAVQRRLLLKKRALAAGTAAAGVAFVGASLYSFSLNRDLHNRIEASAGHVYQAIIREAKPFVEGIQDRDFEQFRQQIEVLQTDHETRPPLARRWGMNRETTLYPVARDLYLALFHKFYRDQTRTHVEETLRGFAADPSRAPQAHDSDFYYSYLKTYLMLSYTSGATELGHLDRPFLADWLRRIWQDLLPVRYGQKAATADAKNTIDRQIDLYSRVLQPDQVPFPRDLGLVSATRAALQQSPYPERIYARIQREVMQQYKPVPVTLASLLQGQKTSLLESSDEIPGFFTPQFDNGLFRKVMDRILDRAYADSWVLDVPKDSRAEVERRIHTLYREDYIRRWLQFLAAVKLRAVSTREETITLLQGLTQENSVLVALLKAVDDHTSFSKLSDFVCDVSKGWIHGSASPHPVAEAFHSLHEFVVSCPENQGAPLKQYMQELQQLRDALSRSVEGGMPSSEQLQAEHRLAAITGRLDQRIRSSAEQLLLQPIHMVDVEKRQELSRDCAQAIGSLYPFRPDSADEVTIPNLIDFFNPQSGRLLAFYKSNVSPVSAEEIAKTGASSDTVPGTALQQVKAISDALFPSGSPEPNVPFELKPNATGGVGLSEIRLMIEGQELTYQMGPEFYSPFHWTGRSDERGALLQIAVGTDEAQRKSYTKQYEGRWGLFRMLQEGHPVPISPTEYRLSWKFSVGMKEPVVIRFDLKAEHVKHPFAPGFFAKFKCP